MTKDSPTREVLDIFVKSALQKVLEFNGIAHLLILEGPKSELFEAISRITNDIKKLAADCEQSELVHFIVRVIDTQFDLIRTENIHITDRVKQEILANVAKLKENIIAIGKVQNQKTSKEEQDHSKEQTELLASIGQLSIWSFHEIMNALARLHGFTEMLDDLYVNMTNTAHEEKILSSKDSLLLKMVKEKLIVNINYMTGIVNRLRAMRGKTKLSATDYNIRNVVQKIQGLTGQPKKSANWSTLNIPSVHIKIDNTIFEQVWVHLWKLLFEWQTVGTLSRAKCIGKIEQILSKSTEKYKNKLFIYIWIEGEVDEKFAPDSLTYSNLETPKPDIANVFHFTSEVAKQCSIDISCSKTPLGSVIFCISMPCSDLVQEVSPETGNAIPQPLHIYKKEVISEEKALKHILVVDDEKDLRTILSLKISKMGYGVYVAGNLAEARKIINEKEINLVLSDLFLGGESGLFLLKELSSEKPDLPFVFITGADEDDVPPSIFNVLEKSAKGFLKKPISTQVLKFTIEKILSNK